MMFDVHPDLRRYVSVTFFVSAGVGVFGVLFLILGLTGVHGSAKGPSWPFVIFGVVAILSGCVGMTIVPRQHRYASRVVASVTATPQRIVLELESDSDSTSLYATPIDSTARQRARRLGLLLPIWSVQSLLGKPLDVSVYLDPATNQPVAFRTAKGVLWCLLPWQSVV
jgi:hypothetical protein